ncbi:MAG: baseplate assembly protein [Sphingomonadales bacterium 63-6]|nr:MAG: baseplate assembly protein [Sphingomonadales bacterium 63-6]
MLSGSTTTSSAIDLSRLPPPDVIETLDFESILAAMLADLQTRWSDFDALTESDPAMKILQVAAYRELLLRQRVNEACRAVMLAYAGGGDLDQLAALVGVQRLEITPADEQAGTPAVMEADDDLRERVVLAPDSFSVAGPTLAYVFHARSAHPDVLDATVQSPEPGEVVVTILSRQDTGEPEPEVIDAVENRVNSRSVRPLTDLVSVLPATIVEFLIKARIYLFDGPDPTVVIEAAQASAQAYVARSRKLGRDINLSAISAALFVEGVQRVELVSPVADLVMGMSEAGHCTGIELEFAGNAD